MVVSFPASTEVPVTVGVTVTVGDGLASSAFTKADASMSVMESGMTTDLSVTLPRALGPMAVTS